MHENQIRTRKWHLKNLTEFLSTNARKTENYTNPEAVSKSLAVSNWRSTGSWKKSWLVKIFAHGISHASDAFSENKISTKKMSRNSDSKFFSQNFSVIGKEIWDDFEVWKSDWEFQMISGDTRLVYAKFEQIK